MQRIKFTRIAGWIAVVIGANAIVQVLFWSSIWIQSESSMRIFLDSFGNISGEGILFWFIGLAIINFGQLPVGINILRAKKKARSQILVYQLVYIIGMELLNILVIPMPGFIANYGFLGVLILPAVISLLILIGKKEELSPSDFRIV